MVPLANFNLSEDRIYLEKYTKYICYKHNKWELKERGGKVPLSPLKYLVRFHCSIFTQIPLLFLRILITSSVKFVLFLLPPPFLVWSRAGTKHNFIHNRLWSGIRDHYCSYSSQNRRDAYWRSEERHTMAIRGSYRTS